VGIAVNQSWNYNETIAGKVFSRDAEGKNPPQLRRRAGYVRMRKQF
jgi:hypothetical protein